MTAPLVQTVPDPSAAAEPAWLPSPDVIEHSNIAAAMRELRLTSYGDFHRFSVTDRAGYWELVLRRTGIRFRRPYERVLDPASPPHRARWFVGAQLNIVESCFQAGDADEAIIYGGDGGLRRVSYGELELAVRRVAGALAARGIGPGDAVAIVAPLTPESVAAYLGTIYAGASIVSIADSFAPPEIAVRLRIGRCAFAFVSGIVQRAGKRHGVYEKFCAADGPPAVVLPATKAANDALPLRGPDATWDQFLATETRPAPAAVPCAPDDPANILFSSGTTGEPKAIVWDHTSPIKCAADGHFHHDIHPGDVTCWPTSLGWMMGPWLLFATFMNRGAVALYDDAPHDAGFGRFVEAARVNMLGTIPSLVSAWRQSRCMEPFDWSAVHVLSATGECSSPADMRYLMQLPGGRPLIEYCGGTELAGGYIASTVVQPCIPSAFSTPALGCDFVLRDEEGRFGDRGEVFLIGPSIGMSTRLLNRDNDAVYYDGAPPGPAGEALRRHGDQLERFGDGYYRVLGRCDDTMNLGGIKVGCAEIERAVCQLPEVAEAAAVAVPPPGGGPSLLVIFAVVKGSSPQSVDALRRATQQVIREQLNPLFKVHDVRVLPSLPRTASNKILRRELRASYVPDRQEGR